MSFKLPEKFESMGFKRLEKIDSLESGDMIVIPSKNDAPKLHVSLGTLRKWGLSVMSKGSYRTTYGCAHYEAVLPLFGDPSWPGWTHDMNGSHVLLIDEASHDKNYAAEDECAPNVILEDANRIGSAITVEDKIYPLMSLKAHRMRPLFPMTRDNGAAKRPMTFGLKVDMFAREILLKAAGEESFPEMRSSGPLGEFIAAVAAISESADLARHVGLYDSAVEKTCVRTRRGIYRDDNLSYAGELIIGNETIHEEPSCYDSGYFPFRSHGEGGCERSRIIIGKDFLNEIVKRGAVLYRCAEAEKIESAIMAGEVAKDLENRYRTLIRMVKKLAEGVLSEIGEAEGIADRLHKAYESLTPDKETSEALLNMFGKEKIS